MGGKTLLSPRDNAVCGKALAEELVHLVCGAADEWIAKGIIRRMRGEESGVVVSLARMKNEDANSDYVPELAGRLLAKCPDLIDRLDANYRQFLTDAAAKAGKAAAVGTP
jgi:hypothetical protein